MFIVMPDGSLRNLNSFDRIVPMKDGKVELYQTGKPLPVPSSIDYETLLAAMRKSEELVEPEYKVEEPQKTEEPETPLQIEDHSSEPELCDDEGCDHYGTPHVCVNNNAVQNAPEERTQAEVEADEQEQKRNYDEYIDSLATQSFSEFKLPETAIEEPITGTANLETTTAVASGNVKPEGVQSSKRNKKRRKYRPAD